MTVTFTQLSEFINAATVYLGRADTVEGKFTYAVRKLHKVASADFVGYQQQVDDLKVLHAIEKDGKLLKDDKGAYEYTKDGQIALNKAIRQVNAEKVEIAPFYVPAEHVPETLTADFRLAFDGWVIEPDGEMVYDIMTDTKKIRRMVN